MPVFSAMFRSGQGNHSAQYARFAVSTIARNTSACPGDNRAVSLLRQKLFNRFMYESLISYPPLSMFIAPYLAVPSINSANATLTRLPFQAVPCPNQPHHISTATQNPTLSRQTLPYHILTATHYRITPCLTMPCLDLTALPNTYATGHIAHCLDCLAMISRN